MATNALAASSTTTTAIPLLNRSRLCSIHPPQDNLSLRACGLRSPWLGVAGKLSLQSRNLRPLVLKLRSIKATVVFSLPTVNPERLSPTDKVPKWSLKTIKSFAMGELEARKLKYPTTGTEALLMGILIEGTNVASKFLWANGITLTKVREESVKLIGRGDLFFCSPEHPPLTEDAQKALDWALDEKLKSGDSGEITTAHVLLGLWSQEESPGHKILASFGLNDEKVKELKSKILEPGLED